MKCSDSHLFTPVYLKLNDAMAWPEGEKAFYLLSSDGLFLCRNTSFFRSCVPVDRFPSELAGQTPFLQLDYPRIPQAIIEQVVGFFDIIGSSHASEAGVLIVWNRQTKAVEVIVPDQIGWVGTTWRGDSYPIELDYEMPPLPPHLVLLGDIHSHVDGPAYASFTDKSDETHRPGLHLVVGRIFEDPPEFHCEAVADGCRFQIRDLNLVLEGYHRRRLSEVPLEWIQKVTIRSWHSKFRSRVSDDASCSDASRASRDATTSGSTSRSPGRWMDALEAGARPPATKSQAQAAATAQPSPMPSGPSSLSAGNLKNSDAALAPPPTNIRHHPPSP
jgi:hypothetical protein